MEKLWGAEMLTMEQWETKPLCESEAYLEPSRTYTMQLFAKIV